MAKEKRLIATLDFETDPFEYGRIPKPFAVGIAIEDGTYVHRWGKDCAEWAADYLRERKLRVYAHNGGKFDFFFMLKHIDPSLMIINGRIAKCRIGESILVDSYLILPLSLQNMDKDDIDYSIMEENVRDIPENKKEILAYLENDCKYLLDWVLNFIDRFGVKLTIAAAAFGELEKTGYPCKKPSNEKYDDTFRKYYYGGRTQAFKKGVFGGQYKVWDINSAYPRAMLDKHPYGTDYSTISGDDLGSVETLLKIKDFYFIDIVAITKGCLPYKDKDKPREAISYPTDNTPREYHTTKWEVLSGLKTNTLEIIKIKAVHIHTKTKNFTEYVTKFFTEKSEGKEEGNKHKTIFAKLMLNSAYGKFGSDGRKYKKWLIAEEGELPFSDEELKELAVNFKRADEEIERLGWKHEADTEFGQSLWSRPDPASSFFNVAVAASITGWVRAYLWEAICASKGVLYCDTDSVICKEFHGGEKDPIKLGAWDLEGTSRKKKKVYIGGRKLYTMELEEKITKKQDEFPGRIVNGKVVDARRIGDHKVKKAHKGCRLTHEQIKELVISGKEIEWTNDAPSFSLTAGARFVRRNIRST